jgi:ABC-2 type transport system permease protein
MTFLKSSIIKKELLEMIRTSKLLIWAVVCMVFGIVSPLTAYYLPEILSTFGATENIVITFGNITYQDSVEQYIKNFSQIGTIVIILMTMGSVAGEKVDGSLQFLLVRPVGTIRILMAKIVSLLILLVIGLMGSMLTMGFYTWYLFPGFPVFRFVYANLFLLLYFFAIGTLTVSFSAAVGKPILAGVGALGIWLIASIAGAIRSIGAFSFVKLPEQVIQSIEGFPFEWQPTTGTLLLLCVSIIAGNALFKRWEPND